MRGLPLEGTPVANSSALRNTPTPPAPIPRDGIRAPSEDPVFENTRVLIDCDAEPWALPSSSVTEEVPITSERVFWREQRETEAESGDRRRRAAYVQVTAVQQARCRKAALEQAPFPSAASGGEGVLDSGATSQVARSDHPTIRTIVGDTAALAGRGPFATDFSAERAQVDCLDSQLTLLLRAQQELAETVPAKHGWLQSPSSTNSDTATILDLRGYKQRVCLGQ